MCEKTTYNEEYDHSKKFRIENKILIGDEVTIPKETLNVSELVLKTFKSKPDFVGQVDAITGQSYNYAQMTERSVKCALWLKKQGVKLGDIIGLCTDNNLDAMLVFLGTLYLGAVSNTWEQDLSPITARYFLTLTSPTIIFTIPSSAESLRAVIKELRMNTKVIVLGNLDGFESFDDILKGHDTRDVVEFKCTPLNKPEDIAFIVPSSGTTGMPKGTIISHYSLQGGLHASKLDGMKNQICLFTATVRWLFGIILAMKAITSYAKRIVAPDDDDAEAICEFIVKYQVTWFASDPYMLVTFVKNNLLEKYNLSSLKEMVSSGTHFKPEYQEILSKKLPNTFVSNNYGMTDAGSVCSYQTRKSKPGSIGFVAPSVQFKVVDLKTEEDLGPNQIGEFRFKLSTVMTGYYKNPEATKQAFDSKGWLRSGDLGYYDENGELFMIDRISEFINFRSDRVSPGEVEAVLGNHPAVFQAAVLGIPHEVDEQHPMAFVVRVPGKTVTEEELVKFVEKNMPDYCWLRAGVKFLNEFPRTATGKILKRQLYEDYVK